ncbi:MAG: ATP-binding protein [Candidatus Omnitrophica bacterium]|nr:ATP-binding protein [Candidatus Omnitrophota bacterium]
MVKEHIYNYWDSDLPFVVNRNIKIDTETHLINDIVGVRRSGKTYLMMGVIKELLKKTDKKATIYINFESRKLYPLTSDYFNQVVSFIYEEDLMDIYPRIYVFFDEVQKIKGWEQFVRSIYDEFKGKIKIFVSGSNTNLLSKDYGELLTGRHLTVNVHPLSFKEFLRFRNFNIEFLSDKKIVQVKKNLKEYLKSGGFPEIVLSEKKDILLDQLFNDILARDILKRAVRKEQIMEEFAYFLASNISNLLSFNKMANYFKTRGIKVSVPTIENYFYLMKNAFLFFDSLLFSYKVKDQLQYPRKVYCIDTGLINLAGFKFSRDIGKLYENVVAIELYRRFSSRPGVKVFYWKNSREKEVDFVIKEGLKIIQLIQVSCFEKFEQMASREIKSLLSASEELECNDLLVVTSGCEGEKKFSFNKKNKMIKFIPLWKWLLN